MCIVPRNGSCYSIPEFPKLSGDLCGETVAQNSIVLCNGLVVSYFQEQVLAFFLNQIVVIRARNKTIRHLRCTVGMCGGMRASRAPRAFCDACGIYRGYGGDLHARGPFVG